MYHVRYSVWTVHSIFLLIDLVHYINILNCYIDKLEEFITFSFFRGLANRWWNSNQMDYYLSDGFILLLNCSINTKNGKIIKIICITSETIELQTIQFNQLEPNFQFLFWCHEDYDSWKCFNCFHDIIRFY